MEDKDVNAEKKAGKALKSIKKKVNLKTGLVVLLLVLSLGAAFYFWQESENAKSNTPEAIAAKNQEESGQIVNQLSAILLIQSEADPTVARVEDPDTLKAANPDFYANAETGDYLILYPQRAIIYRAQENKIINIAPIIDASQIGNSQSSDDESDSDL